MDTEKSPETTGQPDAWPSDWMRAVLGLLALQALESGPSYGYAIIADLEAQHFGTVKGGTLYPLLSRYEAAGLVAIEWRPGESGPGRKYFSLTDLGRAELNRLRADWGRFTDRTQHSLHLTPTAERKTQ